MDFTFSEDQLLFQESVRDFLTNEVTPEKIRGLWDTDSGRSSQLWQQLAELGLTGMTVDEDHGGLGMNAVDFVLLAIEAGYVALPAPLTHTALVAVPVLQKIGGELADEWLPKIVSGEAIVCVGLETNLLVEDAHIADLLLIEKDGELFAVDPKSAQLTRNESVDPSRRLFSVSFTQGDKVGGQALIDLALNGGALASAAEAQGLAQRMIDLSVTYTSERKQFGVAIGTFQAVKHHMANIAWKLEYAKAPLYRAAYAFANGNENAAMAISHAKFASCEAADLAAKNSIQVHGAMGYTWEVDLHIFMKKAWALNSTWGDQAFHKQRVSEYVLGEAIGAGTTFSAEAAAA